MDNFLNRNDALVWARLGDNLFQLVKLQRRDRQQTQLVHGDDLCRTERESGFVKIPLGTGLKGAILVVSISIFETLSRKYRTLRNLIWFLGYLFR